jgi:5'(3')-deoxyribonucleotidase
MAGMIAKQELVLDHNPNINAISVIFCEIRAIFTHTVLITDKGKHLETSLITESCLVEECSLEVDH